MAMEEEDILKTAFCTGSSGLYEFTRMPFGLTNADTSFCRLMEMCIGDQQYVTLLIYLDDISIFGETADQMLDCIELVFSCLKEFNLKIKPKKLHFFQTSVTFKQKILKGEMKKSDLPEFQWTLACQLKKALTEAPVLAYPDYSKPFILETDASLKGLGTVLSQKGDDNEIRVIAYAQSISSAFRKIHVRLQFG